MGDTRFHDDANHGQGATAVTMDMMFINHYRNNNNAKTINRQHRHSHHDSINKIKDVTCGVMLPYTSGKRSCISTGFSQQLRMGKVTKIK